MEVYEFGPVYALQLLINEQPWLPKILGGLTILFFVIWLLDQDKQRDDSAPIRRKYNYSPSQQEPATPQRVASREVPGALKRRWATTLYPDGMKNEAVAQSNRALRRSASNPRAKQFVPRLTSEQSDKIAKRLTEVELQKLHRSHGWSEFAEQTQNR